MKYKHLFLSVALVATAMPAVSGETVTDAEAEKVFYLTAHDALTSGYENAAFIPTDDFEAETIFRATAERAFRDAEASRTHRPSA
jgi:hypothetical protein